MSEWETIKEYEHDGWSIAVALTPDYDYRPGEDDDIYPRFEEVGYYGDDTEERDYYDGRFVRQPIIVSARSGQLKVTPDEIARLIEVGGMNPRTARKTIESDARAIAGEQLTWAIVRVTATCGGLTGTDYLGAVEYDLRERVPERYALETVEHYAMADNAIEDAARKVLGGLAPLALSY